MASLDPQRTVTTQPDAAPPRPTRAPLVIDATRTSPLARTLTLGGILATAFWLALAFWYLAVEMGWTAFAEMLPHEKALIVIDSAVLPRP
jgi:hypothetical protein